MPIESVAAWRSGVGGQAVAAGRLQATVAGDLGDQDEVGPERTRLVTESRGCGEGTWADRSGARPSWELVDAR
jgi:hypothetical protein